MRARLATTSNLGKGLVVLLAVAVIASAAGAGTSRMRVVHNRDGLSARDNRNFSPLPDTSGAIGRRYYVEAVIPRLGIFDRKTLKQVAARDAYSFWHRKNVNQIVDPNVVWDDAARRWYLVSLFNGSGGHDNELLFAWTKRDVPLNLDTAWCRMSIPVGALFDDFPKLGFSRNHIVIGTNLFDALASPPEFFSARVWTLGKPRSARGCGRLPVRWFGSRDRPIKRADGHLAFTPVPVVSTRPSGYVVAADCVFEPDNGEEPPPCGARNRTANQITVWHVTGSRGSPHLVRDGGVDVPVYRVPRPVRQRGTADPIDPSDTRLYQAVAAPDPSRHIPLAIWTQHAVAGPGGHSEVRWYEIDPRGPKLVRSGRVVKHRDWVFSGAIAPTARGNRAVLHYVVAGPDRLPELRARRPGSRGEVVLGRSVSPLRCDPDPGDVCPWGDYAAATPDPVEPGLVWGSNQLIGSPKHPGPGGTYWRTRNFAFRP